MEPIRAAWIGSQDDPTEHHHAIPARDLTNDDYLALDADQRRTVRQSPLYRYVKAKDMPGRSDDADDDDTGQPDDPVTAEPAIAAEEGEAS